MYKCTRSTREVFVVLLCVYVLIFFSCSHDNRPTPKAKKNTDSARTGASGEAALRPVKFNVFLENSMSMDGYVKGHTDFERQVYDLLTKLQIKYGEENMSLAFINDDIRPVPPDVGEFVNKLEPGKFGYGGGNRGTTDISDMLESILTKVDENQVGIYISDCVFSVGKKNLENAVDYMQTQTVGITIDLSKKIKELDLSVLILQLESDFNGIYFDKWDNSIPIVQKRPYYIWIIGTHDNLEKIIENGTVDKVYGYKPKIAYFTRNIQSIFPKRELNYKILPQKNNIGTYDIDKQNPNRRIVNAQRSTAKDSKGLFSFSVAVDLNNLYLGSQYFIDTLVYDITGNYTISVETINAPQNKLLEGYSHIITYTTPDLKSGDVRTSIKFIMPEWVNDISSSDDSTFAYDENERKKTLGLKSILDGVYSAYEFRSKEAVNGKDKKSNIITSYTVSVNKSGQSGASPFIVLAAIIVIIGIVIFIIKKRS